jgi:hypothetical protein
MGHPNQQPGLIDASIGLSSKESLTRKFTTVHDQPPNRAIVPSGLA